MMKKQQLRVLAGLCLGVLLSGILSATPAGNLRIVASGNTSAEPHGGWFTGLGQRGHTYTMTAAVVANLMDSTSNDLVLSFDTIYISGDVVIDRSKITGNQSLTLRANDYATGAIVFETGASLTLKAASGSSSVVTLACANIPGFPKVIAERVVLSNITTAYKRVEMNGFKNWKQWQIDSLLAHATKLGPEIGNGAYDFSQNTLFTIDQNHVFSMTAQTDFLNGQKIGFKNMDRAGKLLPDTNYSLGAYPDSFYVDLSKAEGIRFKVELKGSAKSFNIGLSNCLKKGQWHEHCFEYYVYDIPFTAVDKDGYVTLPFSMFEKVSWSGTWDLSLLIVFIMEVQDITKGSVVSFSDVHGYTTTTQTHPELMVGNMEVYNMLELKANDGKIRQLQGTRLQAAQTTVSANGSVLLPSPDNVLGGTVNVTSSYTFMQYRAATPSRSSISINATALARFSLDKVWDDNVSKGQTYNLQRTLSDTLPHSYEAAFTNAYVSFDMEHDHDICRSEALELLPKSSATGLSCQWYDANGARLVKDTLRIPAYQNEGRYRYFVETDAVYGSYTYNLMRGAVVDVWPEYEDKDTMTICASSLPLQWKDTTFQSGTVSGFYRLARQTVHGCDSVMELLLTVNEESFTQVSDTVCEGSAYQRYGFDIPADSTVGKKLLSDTLVTTNVAGCDSVSVLLLTVLPTSHTELVEVRVPEFDGETGVFLMDLNG